ncbi:hypothetical protein NE237_005214 [Protea cynaroides]|uniref:Phospholipid/glycerol acyltransferase domain-containing protein n=1 Tax=Protea cynaroides TaxID=273540 RepID=A0A9Q0QU25_9MAGN|nr:hypothetical protein NE237_005214 [Protea cynaroides]
MIRIMVGMMLPMSIFPYTTQLFGGKIVVKRKPPSAGSSSGVLFVCTHRTLMDPIPAVTYSISRFSEILSPIPTVQLRRTRDMDADKIKTELTEGDLVVCPEGTTCREPFLLRFSALFVELTNPIVPVTMNYRVGFFHGIQIVSSLRFGRRGGDPTGWSPCGGRMNLTPPFEPTSQADKRGWKALDPIFFFMNPRPIYEVTFLNQLPVEATCSAGKSPHDLANYVQRILAATLGFDCTNSTKKDKYQVLAGNDGTMSYTPAASIDLIKKVVSIFKPFICTLH